MQIGNFHCNEAVCYKMGKARFMATHKHVRDVETVWSAIEKAMEKSVPLKESKPKKGNDETEGETETN